MGRWLTKILHSQSRFTLGTAKTVANSLDNSYIVGIGMAPKGLVHTNAPDNNAMNTKSGPSRGFDMEDLSSGRGDRCRYVAFNES